MYCFPLCVAVFFTALQLFPVSWSYVVFSTSSDTVPWNVMDSVSDNTCGNGSFQSDQCSRFLTSLLQCWLTFVCTVVVWVTFLYFAAHRYAVCCGFEGTLFCSVYLCLANVIVRACTGVVHRSTTCCSICGAWHAVGVAECVQVSGARPLTRRWMFRQMAVLSCKFTEEIKMCEYFLNKQ